MQMFAIYECAACILIVWIGMTLLFIASVVFLVLVESCTIVVRKLADLTRAATFR